MRTGQKVRITKRLYSHGFEIGEVVTLREPTEWDSTHWYADGGWVITSEEFEPLTAEEQGGKVKE